MFYQLKIQVMFYSLLGLYLVLEEELKVAVVNYVSSVNIITIIIIMLNGKVDHKGPRLSHVGEVMRSRTISAIVRL